MLDTIPKSDPQPDPKTLKLSNHPGSNGEAVAFEALVGRKVGDMGFRYVISSLLQFRLSTQI